MKKHFLFEQKRKQCVLRSCIAQYSYRTTCLTPRTPSQEDRDDQPDLIWSNVEPRPTDHSSCSPLL